MQNRLQHYKHRHLHSGWRSGTIRLCTPASPYFQQRWWIFLEEKIISKSAHQIFALPSMEFGINNFNKFRKLRNYPSSKRWFLAIEYLFQVCHWLWCTCMQFRHKTSLRTESTSYRQKIWCKLPLQLREFQLNQPKPEKKMK